MAAGVGDEGLDVVDLEAEMAKQRLLRAGVGLLEELDEGAAAGMQEEPIALAGGIAGTGARP